MNILSLLCEGKENAKSRAEISNATGLSDREVRKELSMLRQSGHIICNTQDGNGYYLSDDTADILGQYKQLNNRILSQLIQLNFLKKKLKERNIQFKNGKVFDGRQSENGKTSKTGA